MPIDNSGGGPAASATIPNDDLLDDLQAGDEELGTTLRASGDYDVSNVVSSDAADPVNTPDMPVIPAPPADPSHPAGTAQEGDPAERPPVNLDIDAEPAPRRAS